MLDTLKIVGMGALWVVGVLAVGLMVATHFHLSIPEDGIMLATACTLMWAARLLSRTTFTRESVAYGLKRIGYAALVCGVPALFLHATNKTPEQAHQERVANAEAGFVRQAIRSHRIPPDAKGAICDTRDNLIGYETFEGETVIFDGVSLAVTPATCW